MPKKTAEAGASSSGASCAIGNWLRQTPPYPPRSSIRKIPPQDTGDHPAESLRVLRRNVKVKAQIEKPLRKEIVE